MRLSVRLCERDCVFVYGKCIPVHCLSLSVCVSRFQFLALFGCVCVCDCGNCVWVCADVCLSSSFVFFVEICRCT